MSTLDGVLPGIVDAGVHFFPPRDDRWVPTPTGRLGGNPVVRGLLSPARRLVRLLPGGGSGPAYIDPKVAASRYGLAEYRRDAAGVDAAAGVPVDTVVHVESLWGAGELSPDEAAAAALAETEWLASLPFGVDGAPVLGGIVIAADPRRAGFAEEVERHRDVTGLVRGVRLRAAVHPDPGICDFAKTAPSLADRDFLTAFETIAAAGLVADVFCYSHQLSDVDTLAREFPDTRIVVGNFGVPVGVFGPTGQRTGATAAARADILRLWRERMSMLANRRNVAVSMSGIASSLLGYGNERSGNIGGQHTLAGMIGPLVLHVLDRFGPGRVMFGSDSPVDRPNASLGIQVGAMLDVLAPRGEHVLSEVFSSAARRTYSIS